MSECLTLPVSQASPVKGHLFPLLELSTEKDYRSVCVRCGGATGPGNESDLEPYLHLGAEFPTEGNWCLVSSLQGAVKLLVSLSKAQKQLNHPGQRPQFRAMSRMVPLPHRTKVLAGCLVAICRKPIVDSIHHTNQFQTR